MGLQGQGKFALNQGQGFCCGSNHQLPSKKINVTCFKNHEKRLFILISGSFTDLHKYTERSEGSGSEKGRRMGLSEAEAQWGRTIWLGGVSQALRGVRAEGMNWEVVERLKHYT